MTTMQIVCVNLQIFCSLTCILFLAGRFPISRAYRNMLLIHTASMLFEIAAFFVSRSSNSYTSAILLGINTALLVCRLLFLFAAIRYLLRCPERRDIAEKATLTSGILIPFLAVCLYIYAPELNFISAGLSLTLTCLWLPAEQRRQVDNQASQQEVLDTIIAQLHPHFLFNALNVIQYLCRTDTNQASRTINSFAKYLRANLNALKRTAPIPLQEDISCLKAYLDIQQLRFPEIRFSFDMKTTDFPVPAMTLSVLAGSAIKHIMQQGSEGGTVTISSWEETAAFHLQIADSAFQDFSAEQNISLVDIRTKVASMCRGTMSVGTAPGQGVTVHIQIPKEIP